MSLLSYIKLMTDESRMICKKKRMVLTTRICFSNNSICICEKMSTGVLAELNWKAVNKGVEPENLTVT